MRSNTYARTHAIYVQAHMLTGQGTKRQAQLIRLGWLEEGARLGQTTWGLAS